MLFSRPLALKNSFSCNSEIKVRTERFFFFFFGPNPPPAHSRNGRRIGHRQWAELIRQRSTLASVLAVTALTPADADEHPLAQLVGGVGEDDGGVEVATLAEHPEEVGGVKVVEGGGDQAAPDLQEQSGLRETWTEDRGPEEPA